MWVLEIRTDNSNVNLRFRRGHQGLLPPPSPLGWCDLGLEQLVAKAFVAIGTKGSSEAAVPSPCTSFRRSGSTAPILLKGVVQRVIGVDLGMVGNSQ